MGAGIGKSLEKVRRMRDASLRDASWRAGWCRNRRSSLGKIQVSEDEDDEIEEVNENSEVLALGRGESRKERDFLIRQPCECQQGRRTRGAIPLNGT